MTALRAVVAAIALSTASTVLAQAGVAGSCNVGDQFGSFTLKKR
jgi:hypothetical protein